MHSPTRQVAAGESRERSPHGSSSYLLHASLGGANIQLEIHSASGDPPHQSLGAHKRLRCGRLHGELGVVMVVVIAAVGVCAWFDSIRFETNRVVPVRIEWPTTLVSNDNGISSPHCTTCELSAVCQQPSLASAPTLLSGLHKIPITRAPISAPAASWAGWLAYRLMKCLSQPTGMQSPNDLLTAELLTNAIDVTSRRKSARRWAR